MSAKTIIYLFISIGSVAGAYIPSLWGGSLFSISSILLSGLGAIIGLILASNLTR